MKMTREFLPGEDWEKYSNRISKDWLKPVNMTYWRIVTSVILVNKNPIKVTEFRCKLFSPQTVYINSLICPVIISEPNGVETNTTSLLFNPNYRVQPYSGIISNRIEYRPSQKNWFNCSSDVVYKNITLLAVDELSKRTNIARCHAYRWIHSLEKDDTSKAGYCVSLLITPDMDFYEIR